MTFLLVVFAGAAAIVGGVWVRAEIRWRRLAGRPVLTCAEVAGAEPGTAVLVGGRTAAGPIEPSRLTLRPAVQWVLIRRHTRVISSEAEETTEHVEGRWGEIRLVGDGAEVMVDEFVARRALPSGGGAMTHEFGPGEADHDRTSNTYDRMVERWVEPDVPVVVAGVVTEDHGLAKVTWVDGTARSELADLPARRLRYRRSAGIAVLCLLLAAAFFLSIR